MIERPSFWNGIRSSVKAMIPDFPFDTPIGMRNFNCDSKVLFLSRLVAFISDSMHAYSHDNYPRSRSAKTKGRSDQWNEYEDDEGDAHQSMY